MQKQALLASLKRQGFNKKIIEAFKKVRREDFIPQEFKEYAYEDMPLSIGHEQTISQPYTIAFMLNLLELDTRKNNLKILEIGSGSGYVLALMNEIIKNKNSRAEIYGIERVKELAEKSREILKQYKNIEAINKNGASGLKEKAPFDRILVSAACPRIPSHLFNQLGNNGIMVASVKYSIFQFKKQNSTISSREFPGFVFVPLVEE